MNDLRNDPAQAFAALREQFGAAADAITDPNARYSTPAVLTAEQLRTEPMPELRSPQARSADAEARDLRTAGDKLAELQRQVSALQETARLHDATLLAIARRFDELAARPLAMAEDAWGVG